MKHITPGKGVALRNKYLSALTITLLLFFSANAQYDSTKLPQTVSGVGFDWGKGIFRTLLRTPYGLPVLAVRDSGAISYYAGSHYKWTGHAWTAIAGASDTTAFHSSAYNDTKFVHLTGTETVAGSKTFTSPFTISTISTANQFEIYKSGIFRFGISQTGKAIGRMDRSFNDSNLVNKWYVDTQDQLIKDSIIQNETLDLVTTFGDSTENYLKVGGLKTSGIDLKDNTGKIVSVVPGALDSNYYFVLPHNRGISGQVLTSGGYALATYWSTPSGGGTWGSITGTLSSQTDLQSALNLKSTIASPTFTGTPAAPTASVGTNTTQIATTAFVQANRGIINGTTTYTGSTAGNYLVWDSSGYIVTKPAISIVLTSPRNHDRFEYDSVNNTLVNYHPDSIWVGSDNKLHYKSVYSGLEYSVAGNVASLIPITFPTQSSGAGLVNTSGLWTTTSTTAGYGNQGLSSYYLPSGQDGWVQITMDSLNSYGFQFGFATTNALTGYASMKAAMSSNTSLVYYTEGGSQTSTGEIPRQGWIYRINRVSGVLTLEKSADGSTGWTTLHTYDSGTPYTSPLYIVVDMFGANYSQFSQPKGFNIQ